MATPPATPIDEILQHSSWVRQLAFSLTRDPNEADELVQEVWLRTLRRPPHLGVPVRAWLSRVMHNAASSLRRSRARRAERERQHAKGMVAPSVMETLERADLQTFLLQAMQRLPAPDRALMAMRYLEGMPPRTLAREFDLPVETVRKRLQRTRAVLREQLERSFGDDWESSCLAFALLPVAPAGAAGVLLAGVQARLVVAAAVVCAIGTAWVAYEVTTVVSSPTARAVEQTRSVREGDGRSYPEARPEGSAARKGTSAAARRSRETQEALATGSQNRGTARSGSTQKTDVPRVNGQNRLSGSVSEIANEKLSKLLRRWFEARLLRSSATSKWRDKFLKVWGATTKHVKMIGDQSVLGSVFHNVFPRKARPGRGKPTKRRSENGTYAIQVPRRYDPRQSNSLFMFLPERQESSSRWADPIRWLEKVWAGRLRSERAIGASPAIPSFMDMGSPLEPGYSNSEGKEQERLDLVLPVLQEIRENYRINSDRVVLVSGRGNSAFALRLATYFPSRFAGLVLRHPDWDGNLRLGSLKNLPVLLIPDGARSFAWERLRQEIDRVGARCTVLDHDEDDPLGFVVRWGMKQRRDLMIESVVLEPSSLRFRSGYWVELGACDERPHIEATILRDVRTIMIETRGVRDFVIQLNDSLIPLDSFRIRLNGRQATYKLEPSIEYLAERVYETRDERQLFSAQLRVSVPSSTQVESK